jgi:hypothetical protein
VRRVEGKWPIRLISSFGHGDNSTMSRKVLLVIAAAGELCLGAYFLLAFFGWCARIYLFNAGRERFSIMIVVWFVLAASCFVLYGITRRKLKDMGL